MEYLGAKIDIDISSFMDKANSASRQADRLAQKMDDDFKRISESLKKHLDEVGTVDLSKSIKDLQTDLSQLNSTKGLQGSQFSMALGKLSELEGTAKRLYDTVKDKQTELNETMEETSENVEKLSDDIQSVIDNIQGFEEVANNLVGGENVEVVNLGKSIQSLLGDFKTGQIDLKTFGEELTEIGDAAKRVQTMQLSKDDKQKLKGLNTELGITKKKIDAIIKSEGAGDAVEKTSKKLSTFGKLVTRVAGHLIPRNFRYMFTAIRGAIGSTGVGALILAVIGYIKMLYEWNKKLIGLKWGDFKDRLKVATGYMKEEDALTASIKRRTDAIKEQTQALTDNVKAQREAASPLAKAQAIQQRNMAVNDAFKNIVGDREFHFFGGAKAKDIQDVLDMVSGDANKKAVKRYFDIMSNDEEVEKMSQKQLDDMQFELEKALQLSDKQKEVNKALDEWDKVKGFEEDAYGAIALQQIDAKNNLEKANKAYDETLKYYEDIEKKRKQIENAMSSQTLNYELGELKASMNNLGLKEIGGTDWARLQSSIDSIETASKMRGDNRGWTLSEYDRLLDKKKKNIEMSGKEDTQTRKLSAEIETLTAKINYLNNNEVKSRTQRLMTETLELEKQQKIIERENAKYKEQETALEHILGIERKRAEINGRAGYDLGNIDLEIETIDKKIGGLRGQKNISAEEMRQLENLFGSVASTESETEIAFPDFPAFSEMMGNDKEAMTDILSVFVQSTADDMVLMNQLIEQEDFVGMQSLCHKMLPMFTQLERDTTFLARMNAMRGCGETEADYPNWKDDAAQFMAQADELMDLLEEKYGIG